MNYDLIIFDCDGTLVDTEYAVNAAFLESVYKFAPPDYKKFDVAHILKNCIGETVYDIFERMAKEVEHPITKDIQGEIILDYQNIFPTYAKKYIQPDHNLIFILDELSKKFKLCVASNGRIRNVKNSIEAAGLSRFFGQNVFSAEQVVKPKPAPDLILYSLKKMGLTDTNRALHIEDTGKGITAGIKAGVTAIGFIGHAPDKSKSAEQMALAGATQIFDSWDGVKGFILGEH